MTGSYSRTVMDGSWLTEPQHTVPLCAISDELRLREDRWCCKYISLMLHRHKAQLSDVFPQNHVAMSIIQSLHSLTQYCLRECHRYSGLVFQSCITCREFCSVYEIFHDIRDCRLWNPKISCNCLLLVNIWTIFLCSFSQTGELHLILAYKQCSLHT